MKYPKPHIKLFVHNGGELNLCNLTIDYRVFTPVYSALVYLRKGDDELIGFTKRKTLPQVIADSLYMARYYHGFDLKQLARGEG